MSKWIVDIPTSLIPGGFTIHDITSFTSTAFYARYIVPAVIVPLVYVALLLAICCLSTSQFACAPKWDVRSYLMDSIFKGICIIMFYILVIVLVCGIIIFSNTFYAQAVDVFRDNIGHVDYILDEIVLLPDPTSYVTDLTNNCSVDNTTFVDTMLDTIQNVKNTFEQIDNTLSDVDVQLGQSVGYYNGAWSGVVSLIILLASIPAGAAFYVVLKDARMEIARPNGEVVFQTAFITALVLTSVFGVPIVFTYGLSSAVIGDVCYRGDYDEFFQRVAWIGQGNPGELEDYCNTTTGQYICYYQNCSSPAVINPFEELNDDLYDYADTLDDIGQESAQCGQAASDLKAQLLEYTDASIILNCTFVNGRYRDIMNNGVCGRLAESISLTYLLFLISTLVLLFTGVYQCAFYNQVEVESDDKYDRLHRTYGGREWCC